MKRRYVTKAEFSFCYFDHYVVRHVFDGEGWPVEQCDWLGDIHMVPIGLSQALGDIIYPRAEEATVIWARERDR